MKQYGRRFLCIQMLALLLCACVPVAPAAAPLPEGASRICLLDHEKTAVAPEAFVFTADASDPYARVAEMADALRTPPKDNNRIAPLTEQAVLLEFRLEDGLLTLDFDVRYLEQDPATEALTRAAIVLSFTGIDGVDGVLFLVSGTALMKNETEPVGVMHADSFLMSVLP